MFFALRCTALACVTLLLVACDKDASSGTVAVDPNAPRHTPAPATHGTIRVRVELEGEAPVPEPIRITADQQTCEAALFTERWVVKDGKIANAFVFIESPLPAMNYPDDAPVVLDQKQCRYVPHVAGVRAGQLVKVLNSDPTYHNVLGTPRKNEPFNIGMAQGQDPLEFRFANADKMKLVCSVHPWMDAWLHVVPHPFFATSGEDGVAELKGVPAGEYQIQIWHEAHQKEPPKRSVVVKAGETTEIVVKLAAR
ncbi:MAG: hypothetical protein IPN34_09840 [Planctomycetes bacterium]|nr:hypothetical protein [Planctomycetota bacterium]